MMCSRIALAAAAMSVYLAATVVPFPPAGPATAQQHSADSPVIERVSTGGSGQIAVPADSGPARASLPHVAGSDEEQLRRASALAEAATRRFDELMPKSAAATPAAPPVAPVAMAPSTTSDRIVVAQAQPRQVPAASPIQTAQAQAPAKSTTPPAAAPASKPADDDFLAPVWDWLERSNRQYQSVIVKQLSTGEGAPVTLAAPIPSVPVPSTRPVQPAAPPVASAPKSAPPATVVTQAPPATKSVAQAPAPTPAAAPPAAPAVKPAAPAVTAAAPQEKDFIDNIQESVTDWIDRSTRQYNSIIVKRLSDPNPPDSAAALSRMPPVTAPPATIPVPAAPAVVASAKQPTQKAVEDAARLAEQQKRDADNKRVTEAAETKRQADARKGDEDARIAAAAKAKSDEDARIAAAAKAKSDEDARIAAAAKAKADEDARRTAAKAKADEEKRLADAAKAKAEDDARVAAAAKAKADEDKRLADVAKAKTEQEARVAAAAKAKADEDKRLADVAKAKAEQEARVAAAAKAKADEDKRLADAAKAKADEDKRLADARARADADNRIAALAAVGAAAAAQKAETERKAAQARADEEAKRAIETRRVADAAATKAQAQAQAQSERQTAEATRIAAAKADAARKASEKATAPKPPETTTRAADAAPTKPVTLQRTVRPGARFATSNQTKRRVANYGNGQTASSAKSRGLRFAKASNRVRGSTCATMAGVRVRPGNWYVVKRGDTLWHIAQTHYGDGNKYSVLRRANRGVFDAAGNIYPCQRLEIPRVRGN